MTEKGQLQIGDRVVITRLPEGFIWHIETADGRILNHEPHVQGFAETIAEIRMLEDVT